MVGPLVPGEASAFPRYWSRAASVLACGRNIRYLTARPKRLARTMHLASQHLPHRCHTKGVNLRHSASEFLCKVTATQMNIEHGSLGISMPSKSRDLVNVPVGSRQLGQAQGWQQCG